MIRFFSVFVESRDCLHVISVVVFPVAGELEVVESRRSPLITVKRVTA